MSPESPSCCSPYARPDHLEKLLAGLRENEGPAIVYAFLDGARTPEQQPAVEECSRILRGIDWCEVILNERDENWGLGRSILHGVTEVFKQHDALIVFEDDLIACRALIVISVPRWNTTATIRA